MLPEQRARQLIDRQLEAAGWAVQDYRAVNLGAAEGVAVREFPTDDGPADYMLFVARKPVGVVEAKPEGTTLSGVAEQTERYIASRPKNVPGGTAPLRFAYEASGAETLFRDTAEPSPRSRRVFAFHTPATLRDWAARAETLRSRLRAMPPVITAGLRACQAEAIENLERSLAEARPRALVQMATGSGKTFTAVGEIYRLIKHGGARRVLFLVDRANLGRQTLAEFQKYETPDDGRKFTDLYNVQHLRSNALDPVCRVTIATIQRVYSMLSGEELPEETEEMSTYEADLPAARPKEVAYTARIPIEAFDVIVIDECHRSIYNLWRQVLEYFDAFLIGLTATPSKQTIAFFNQNLVMEYNHARAVADGVNVGYDVYRIRTRISEAGARVEAGYAVPKRDRLTRRQRWEVLENDVEYTARQLDRDVVNPSVMRTIIRAFRERLFTEIFPGRTNVPKTLIFAKDDAHAEEITAIVREEFGEGNEFCKKITYRTTGERPEELLNRFRTAYYPRVAVTVDMIATGTDIRPLECLLFMRGVRSNLYFEQMKGRGTRTIATDDLQAVTPDARAKTHFVVVDAVGVCEADRTDSRPLERKRSVPFATLLQQVALGARDEETLSSLAGRLARLGRSMGEGRAAELRAAAGGRSLEEITNGLLAALDTDRQRERALQLRRPGDYGAETEPTEPEIERAALALADEACAPFDDAAFRAALEAARAAAEVMIDVVNPDELIDAGYDAAARERAERMTTTFREFIEANREGLTALQALLNTPYARRHLAYAEVRALAEAIGRPPYQLAPDALWHAYERLDRSRVRGATAERLLTDVIALVRYATGQTELLTPYAGSVAERFEAWARAAERAGRAFTPEQKEWLGMMAEHIAASAEIAMEDFDALPFNRKGGRVRVYQLFGESLEPLLDELNEVLAA